MVVQGRSGLVAGTLVIAALTVAAYCRVVHFDFVNYDDKFYVYANEHVKQGLSLANVRWATTTNELSNWHPLTWLSYMLDVELFGVLPGAMHAVNLGFHVVNAILLSLLLWRITGAIGTSLGIAALFALHPLHVESVAWIAERKDVLSTFFGLLALSAYAWYAAKPSHRRNALVAILLALGLMAKPMLVTWPFLFLLLDYWPLRRPLNRDRILEKVPHFILIAVSCIVTYVVQRDTGAMRTSETVEPLLRVQNAIVAYATYLWKTVWPVELGVLYPYPHEPYSLLVILAAVAFLIAISLLAWSLRRTRPYLLVGWLWYLGTLVPVIGLVQVGDQAYADRYTYVPHIGLFLAFVWLVHDAVARRPWMRRVAYATGGAVIALLAWRTHVQAAYWKDSVSLYTRTLAVTGPNPAIHYNLAAALQDLGRNDEAMKHLEIADRLQPGDPRKMTNMAVALIDEGDLDAAEQQLAAVLNKYPDHVRAHVNMGVVLASRGDYSAAERHLRRAIELDPAEVEAHFNLALAMTLIGKADEARKHVDEVLRLDPAHPSAKQLQAQLGP